MSAPLPLEDRLLARALADLDEVLGDLRSDHRARLEVLEACASRLGGFSFGDFRALDPASYLIPAGDALLAADAVLPAIERTGIQPALALTALAREPLADADRRSMGAYYTDWRLARYLAKGMLRAHRPGDRLIDPASGTGILLVAMALEHTEPKQLRDFIGHSVCAADLSLLALRGVRLALASLTDDLEAIRRLSQRLRATDSLLAGRRMWADVARAGFAAVIGNPPWEKLKITRHEHLGAQGIDRHYGADYEDADLADLDEERRQLMAYAERVGESYVLHGGGELDLYKLFLALALDLTGGNGQLGFLVPAGLIRSDGTQSLRRYLFENTGQLRIGIADNKARHFAIDTRFKFLALHAAMRGDRGAGRIVTLHHLAANEQHVSVTGTAKLDRGELDRLRPDLTIPEVRSEGEWALFRTMAANAAQLGNASSPWKLHIVRELDMTRDRALFERAPEPNYLPLIEGRMVHQFRHAAKSYVSGTGRSAVWDVDEPGSDGLVPQFWVDPANLSASIVERAARDRIGFCDITGQTNERAMLVARIPAGVVCNNKVPTITIEGEESLGPASWLWLGIANSFAFDWLLRRVVTTTVNYFILRSVPFPMVAPEDPQGEHLAGLARAIDVAYHGDQASELSALRADLDARVMDAYGLDLADAELLFTDFPLLDRGQPSLPGDRRSTITRDTALAAFARLIRTDAREWEARRDAALVLGAVAYVPSERARQRARALA